MFPQFGPTDLAEAWKRSTRQIQLAGTNFCLDLTNDITTITSCKSGLAWDIEVIS
jgi:hypothetical protein